MDYLEFLDKIALYLRILELEDLITSYTITCEKNYGDDCYNVLLKCLNDFKEEYNNLLNSTKYANKEELKEAIFRDWSKLAKNLLENEEWRLMGNNQKTIYGMIQEILSKDLDFFNIYSFIIDNNLYDPNTSCGVSSEPFFTLLPLNSVELFRDLNKKVILDERCDFHILRNGSDVFDYACYYYKNASSIEEKEYWHDYLLWTLKGNLSVLDTKRFMSIDKIISWNYPPVIMQIFADEELNYLRDYLFTDEGIRKQCMNAKYFEDEQLKAMDFYLTELDNRGIDKSPLLALKR